MEFSELPVEIRCQIYQRVTNYLDILALLSVYQKNEGELELIYSCIKIIENVPSDRLEDLNFDHVVKFRFLEQLETPIYIESFRDINQIATLKYLKTAIFVSSLNKFSLEELMYHLLPKLPRNLREVYFASSQPIVLYYYNSETRLFGIATKFVEMIDWDITQIIISIIAYIRPYYLYLDIPNDSEDIEAMIETATNIIVCCSNSVLYNTVSQLNPNIKTICCFQPLSNIFNQLNYEL